MKWWLKALVACVLWVPLCIGGAYLFFPANTTPAQDARLSEILGEFCGAGLVFIWVIATLFHSAGKLRAKNKG